MQHPNVETKSSPDSVRRRKTGKKFFADIADATSQAAQPGDVSGANDHSETSTQHDDLEIPTQPSVERRSIEPGTFWFTRIVLLRYLGFIYCEF